MSEPVCIICHGTGSVEGRVCPGCHGSGKETGFFSSTKAYVEEIFGKLPSGSKLTYTSQILAVINATEYAALVDAAKDGLRIHLSCGVLDLDHAGAIYANLMAIFGSSPITKAAIEAL